MADTVEFSAFFSAALAGLLAGAVPVRAEGPPDTALTADSTSLILVPLGFYTPETQIAGAMVVGLMRQFPGRDKPSALESLLMYTQRNQYVVSAKVSHYLAGLAGFFSTGASIEEFPDQYYGIGNGAREEDMEMYSSRNLALDAEANRPFFRRLPALRIGGIGNWTRQSMLETASGGMLESGAVTGSGGFMATRLGPKVAWDTRNSDYFPTMGANLMASAGISHGVLGSDFEFGEVKLDARKYVPVPGGGTVALQALGTAQWGDIPFLLLARLGGDSQLRGYYQGRYRDRNLALLQSEYRFWIWRRLGGALAAGAGSVSDDLPSLASAPIRYAYGGGLRVRLNAEGVNLRVDWAIPREGEGSLYVTMTEAF
jgi:Omp85 superfamily domain